jgi:hypothetical protein
MAKVTRRTLARAVKLTTQHVYTPTQAVATVLSGATVDTSNLEQSWGTFRINFHVPWLDAKYFTNAASGTLRFAIPFTLPPLQEFFDAGGLMTEATPQLVLDEFNMSFDQRGEESAIASRTQVAVVNAGKLFPEAVTQLDLSVALLEKKQWFFDNATPYEPDTEVFSSDLPAEIWIGSNLRLNPFNLSGLNRTLSPYRTYVLVLDATDIFSTDKKVVLPSLQFSLKIRHPLVARDQGVEYVQNIPTTHAGAKVGPTVTITPAVAGDTITADDAKGVQTNLKTVDEVFQGRLGGGYWRDSNVDPAESIDTDAAYDVLCVPMWSGYGNEAILSAELVDSLPINTAAPYAATQQDEISIPLPWPMTIHHVTLAVNHQAPTAGAGGGIGGLLPTSATFTQSVAVGLGVGRKSDLHTYQTVASVTWNNATVASKTIDRLLDVRNSTATGEFPATASRMDWELIHCPLVVGPQGAGTGYYAQGTPFFAGLATSRTMNRSTVGSGDVGNAPFTQGMEQFLQLVWSFEDPNGLAWNGAATPGAAGSEAETYVGYQGNWVQITGKKHLARVHGDIPVGM